MSGEIEYPSKERERAKVNVKVSAEVNTYLHDLYNQIQYEFCEQYEDEIKYLQQKVEQLEKENIKQKEIIENLTTMTVCGDKKQIKNTAQYKLEQLENIRKEVIEYINRKKYQPSPLGFELELNPKELYQLQNILNKGDKNE